MANDLKSIRRFPIGKLNRSGEVKSVSIPFGDDFLEFTYSRAKYTPDFEKQLKELEKEALVGSLFAEFLYSLIVDWNVWDCVNPEEKTEEKQGWFKVPLVKETFMSALSVEGLTTLMEAINEDNRPK